MTESGFTAPVAGTYVFEPGQPPRLRSETDCPVCWHPAASHPSSGSGFTCSRGTTEPGVFQRPSCRDCAAALDRLTQQPVGDGPTHRCDDDCTCPVHGTPLLYAPASNEHACQDPDCEYAQGFELTYGPRYIDVEALVAARNLALVASPAYQRARQAGNDFAASMDRLVTEAGPSQESIDRIKAGILAMAGAVADELVPFDLGPTEPFSLPPWPPHMAGCWYERGTGWGRYGPDGREAVPPEVIADAGLPAVVELSDGLNAVHLRAEPFRNLIPRRSA